MADEGTLEDRFLRELYGLTDGQATRPSAGRSWSAVWAWTRPWGWEG
jgi:hypothetical protein